MTQLRWLVSFALTNAALTAAHADWPQLLGPNRDGAGTGRALAKNWPVEGPRLVWRTNVGHGFAGPVVAQGKVILFHRMADEEILEARDATRGSRLWKFSYPTGYRDGFGFDPGPRATPTVSDGKVFAHGADGLLHALNLADGSMLWSVDSKKEFASAKGFFGRACSPLAAGAAIIVDVGGTGGLVAFNRDTGKVLWKHSGDEASYSSPVAASFGPNRLVLAVTRSQFVGIDAASGKVRFTTAFKPPVHASVTGATPVVVGDRVFISAAYELGAAVFRVDGSRLEPVWRGDEQLSLQFTTPVHLEGFLFGLHGRHDFAGGTELRCVELATGKVRWSKPGLGGANLILAGDSLLLLTENGELIRVAAASDGYREHARTQILGRGVRAYPALVNGLFYARDKTHLVCVDLGSR